MDAVTQSAASQAGGQEKGDGWTSSGLTALVIRGLQARRPDLLPSEAQVPETTHTARAPAGYKRDVLATAYEGGGASLILDLGQDLKHVGFDPIVHVLLNSRTPFIMAEKWERFERYTHSTNRLVLIPEGNASFSTRRHKVSGEATHPAEDLLMLGVMASLLEMIGAEKVSVLLTPDQGRPLALIEDGQIMVGPEKLAFTTALGRIEWKGFTPQASYAAEPDRLVVYGGNEDEPVTGAVTRLIAGDVARGWTWPMIAEELGQPVRSLQRALSNEETSLSELVRAVRVREACRLLEAGQLSLTQIGFWCGFSDSAHFSRDFKKSLGMPPSVYRSTSLG